MNPNQSGLFYARSLYKLFIFSFSYFSRYFKMLLWYNATMKTTTKATKKSKTPRGELDTFTFNINGKDSAISYNDILLAKDALDTLFNTSKNTDNIIVKKNGAALASLDSFYSMVSRTRRALGLGHASHANNITPATEDFDVDNADLKSLETQGLTFKKESELFAQNQQSTHASWWNWFIKRPLLPQYKQWLYAKSQETDSIEGSMLSLVRMKAEAESNKSIKLQMLHDLHKRLYFAFLCQTDRITFDTKIEGYED